MIIWFLLQCIATIFISIVYIAHGNYADGEKAMAPLAVMLAVFIQFLISIVIFYLLKKNFRGNKRIAFFIFNMVIYELSFLFFSNSIPILDIFKSGLVGFLNRGYSLSSVFSGIFIMTAFYIFNLLHPKEIKGQDALD